jgi:hypothetical protein
MVRQGPISVLMEAADSESKRLNELLSDADRGEGWAREVARHRFVCQVGGLISPYIRLLPIAPRDMRSA